MGTRAKRSRAVLRSAGLALVGLLGVVLIKWLHSYITSDGSTHRQVHHAASHAISGSQPQPVSTTHASKQATQHIARPVQTVELCADTCPYAKDGVCDEGWGSAKPSQASYPHQAVRCDLGTDCSDCGTWKGAPTASSSWGEKQGPVAFATRGEGGLPMRVAMTSTQPPFLFPHTDPALDTDASAQMVMGVVEGGISRVVHHALRGRCGNSSGLVLDVGANFGWFALYAAAMGCRVIAWEPVPRFRAFLEYGAALNGVAHLIDVRPAAVSDTAGKVVQMAIPKSGRSLGIASVSGAHLNADDVAYTFDVVTESIDQVVGDQQQVLLMKVDVEGHEPEAMASASHLVTSGRLDHVVMEYSPGIAEWHGSIHDAKPHISILTKLLAAGYTLVHMYDLFAKMPASTSNPPPALPAITAANLAYDMEDASTLCKRLAAAKDVVAQLAHFPYWSSITSVSASGCKLSVPHWSHPKSFRSSFMHNTNIWARRQGAQGGEQSAGATVGMMDLAAPAKRYWAPDTRSGRPTGVASRPCSLLPPDQLVAHRCPCTAEVCKQEEVRVYSLAKAGDMPQNYDL